MAIKRPSKSRGAPLHKPASAAAVRHIDVMTTRQMLAGIVYEGWLCKNRSCGQVIAIGEPPAAGKPAASESSDHLTAIKCPHCADEDLYRWSARSEHTYGPKST